MTASLIVPRIVLNLPMASNADIILSDADLPVEREFVADLSVAYAFDLPQCFQIVAKRDLARLDLDIEKIHPLALANLQERVSDAEFLELSDGTYLLSCGNNNEAAMILLDQVWVQAENMVNGDLVAAVPSRDTVAFTGSENQLGLGVMRSHVSQILELGDHTLTRHFLIRRAGNWRKYEGFAG